jgi:uncharacterized protein (DUF885 family)
MDRRTFLGTGATLALLPVTESTVMAAIAPATAANDARLNATFDRIFNLTIRESPSFATQLGLDKGANARLRYTFDVRPPNVIRSSNAAQTKQGLASVRAFNPRTLSASAALNREIVIYDLETQLLSWDKFQLDSVQNPYLISQQGGAYFSIPDFLNSAHPIENRSDAEAYLSRLAQFPKLLDYDTQDQVELAARGFLAPAWSLQLALGQMEALRKPAAADSDMVQSIVRRTQAQGIAGDWAARATRIVHNGVYPALDRQMATIRRLLPTTRPGDGATRLPHGDEIYAAALGQATTSTMTPEEVHQLGLSQVAEYTASLDSILKQAGLANGTVGERLSTLNTSPTQLYPDTDAGREALIASLNANVHEMMGLLPKAFATLPGQPLEIRRVPPEIQDGAPNGYYNSATLDGSRPAIYFINLKSTADWPKYSLPSLTYHEGVPGHHLQISLAQESKDIPQLRKISFYSSYIEGWALYAEQLSDEIGGYKGIERGGYQQSFLFRSARLVVDTGLNAKGWSREQAVDYMTKTTGFPRPRVQREVERYCISIGQACSYKVGHLAWLRAREKAKAILGAKFDLKQFHEVLKDGSMPLTILERRVEERARAIA